MKIRECLDVNHIYVGVHLSGKDDVLVEVKSMTLAGADGVGRFPDAASERARKHVAALAALASAGVPALLVFCAQHSGVRSATVERDVDPRYARALRA